MNKKQKLKNAVILGLLMSSVTAGSAWAESLNVNNIENDNASGLTYDEIVGILGDMRYYGLVGGTDEYENIDYDNTKVFDSIAVTVKSNYNIWPGKNKKAVGVTSKQGDADAVLKAENNITVNVETRNDKNGYGVLADDDGKKVDMISSSGTIQVSALKTKGHQDSLTGPGDIDYSTANVYGISAYNNGAANLNAGTDIIITAGYDETAAEKYTSLKQGNIYGISNTGGTVDLKAGNVISITANSANGDAYGIYTNSDKLTTLNSKYNQIIAVADGTGTAIGIKAENGAKVAITGDTYVSGDDGALVIEGNNGKDNSEQAIFYGDVIASAKDGAAVDLKDTSVRVVKNMILDGKGLVSDNSQQNIEGSLYTNGTVTGKGVYLTDSILTVGQNVFVHSKDDIAIDVNNSNFTVDGNISISGKDIALKIENDSQKNVEFGNLESINSIVADNTALDLSGKLTMSGTTVFESTAENSTAVKVAENSQFSSTGSVTVSGGAHGVVLNEKGQFTVKDADVNLFKASAAREDVVNQNEHYNAVNVGAGAKFDVSGNLNVLQAGKIDNYFGSETAVSIVGSDTEDGEAKFILTGELGNLIQGAVYSQAGDVKISAKGNNEIYSAAHGYTTGNDGSEHLVSALYAAEDANINLSTENGVNIIKSNAEFIHKDENNHFIDREITVWAENGGNVNIKGAVDIESSNNATYYENGKNGNALGIAISAGGRDLQTDSENNMITPSEWGKVNVDYSSVAQQTSRIIGDIVAGYGGEVNVGQNLAADLLNGQIISTGGDSKLYMEGNALAGNGGKLNLDLGNGGVWYGRADNYGDAGYGEAAKNHTNFYNPAFSNGIVEGGTVNIKMNDGLWVLTGQSWVSELNATGSIIDMAGQYISEENKEMFDMDHTHALVVDNFKGNNSTFIMDLKSDDVANSDMLYIKNNEGTFDIKLANALDEVALDEIGELRFATIHGQVPDFGNGISQWDRPTVMYAGSTFNDVVYEVSTEKFNENDIDNGIYNEGKQTNIKANASETENAGSFENGKPGEDYINNSFENGDTNLIVTGIAGRETGKIGQTIVDMSKANYTNAIYMDRLNKRMGETRFIDGDEGMWVRLRHDRIGKEDSFRSMNTMYEMGYDVKQEKDNGEHRVGVAIDYMDGSTSYSKLGGDGEISRKGIWMYDTWVGEKGHYRDFVAKWGHLANDFDVYAVNGDNVTGDYSNNVYSISAEFGKKNDIGNNWYFEPQAQLQYAHVTGAEYMTNAGTAVNVDDINSLIARAGFRLGKDLGERSTVYFKADLMHEFLGEQDVFAMDDSTGTSGAHERYDHGGTWCDLGFGFATAMSKTSYAYLDVETSLGNDYDETYQINAGLQWTF